MTALAALPVTDTESDIFPPIQIPADAPDYFHRQMEEIDRRVTIAAVKLLAESDPPDVLRSKADYYFRQGMFWLAGTLRDRADNIELDPRLEVAGQAHAATTFGSHKFFLANYCDLVREAAQRKHGD